MSKKENTICITDELADKSIGVLEDLKAVMQQTMPEPERTEICFALSTAIKALKENT